MKNLTIKEIYNYFDKIGSVVFSTVNDGLPESRIAHFRAFDSEGLYFMTMHTKPFYKQLKKTGKVSACGLFAPSQIEHTKDNELLFQPGYSIRISGDVKEISIEEIIKKENPIFDYCIKDQKRYKAMVVFCLYSARGEIFDYDFEKLHRDHKLERFRFSFGDMKTIPSGLKINEKKCISCGKCQKACSFSAITKKENSYYINPNLCDECGDCYINCPVNAINSKGK